MACREPRRHGHAVSWPPVGPCNRYPRHRASSATPCSPGAKMPTIRTQWAPGLHPGWGPQLSRQPRRATLAFLAKVEGACFSRRVRCGDGVEKTGAGVEKAAPRERHACPVVGCSDVGAQSEGHGSNGHPAKPLRGWPTVILRLKCRQGACTGALAREISSMGVPSWSVLPDSPPCAGVGPCGGSGLGAPGGLLALEGRGVTRRWLAVRRRQPGGDTRTPSRPHG